jgi:hypothetical protein
MTGRGRSDSWMRVWNDNQSRIIRRSTLARKMKVAWSTVSGNHQRRPNNEVLRLRNNLSVTQKRRMVSCKRILEEQRTILFRRKELHCTTWRTKCQPLASHRNLNSLVRLSLVILYINMLCYVASVCALSIDKASNSSLRNFFHLMPS